MNTVQCLEAIAGIRRFFQASNLPENVFDALTVLEDYALQQQITRKTKQTKITELFDNMIKKKTTKFCVAMDRFGLVELLVTQTFFNIPWSLSYPGRPCIWAYLKQIVD